ncbi:hypothetical protein AK812_SmicGene32677 [Symbiodinium microadriaticum]|uniref:Uncharacterized protein n=1 Tax=Symbiodinium microadriaticum TaxID=2951 RepID=A0A1Q9CTH4_SYMMI|nr:hypothetical protein AK812_SmicGene32677 [Symbiodinium microadriaticum]
MAWRGRWRHLLSPLLLQAVFRPGAGRTSCEGEQWSQLFRALAEASENKEFWDVFSPQMLEITQSELFDPWTS